MKLRQRAKPPTAVSIARRQAILDHLNAHSMQTMHQISTALGCAQRTVSAYVREMKAVKELRIAGEQRIGKATIPLYGALVRETTQQMPKVNAVSSTLSVVTKEIRPGHIRHLGTHRERPLQDAGGQGRIGCGSGVVSTLGDSAMRIALGG